jgi:hypothetical protein
VYAFDASRVFDLQDEPKAAVDKMAREMLEAAAAEKAQTLQKAASKARLGTSKAAAPPKPPVPPQVPQWDDVAYSIKVLLFANRMQILRCGVLSDGFVLPCRNIRGVLAIFADPATRPALLTRINFIGCIGLC